MWECPQLLEIGGSHVMVPAIWEDDVLHYVAYGVGHYADGRFEARSWGQLSYGKSYYAPSFFRDKDGKPSLIFWVRGVVSPDGQWASALSIQHTLSLDGDTLVAEPHEDLSVYQQPAQLQRVGEASFETVLTAGADLRCTVSARMTVRLESLDQALATVTCGGDGIRVTADGNADFTNAFFPAVEGSELRAIIDSGVLELPGPQGIMAVPLPIVAGPLTLTVAHPVAEPELWTVNRPVTEGALPLSDAGRVLRGVV